VKNSLTLISEQTENFIALDGIQLLSGMLSFFDPIGQTNSPVESLSRTVRLQENMFGMFIRCAARAAEIGHIR
jgi:hypothetical protein